MLLISTKIWDTLTPQVQAWVAQAASESAVYQQDLWAKTTVEAIEKAKAEGVTIYDVDVSLFAAKVVPMLEGIENPEVRELVNQISEVK
jgi:TRAP-type C4-dicarboxylate transport system substrate-binding protein